MKTGGWGARSGRAGAHITRSRPRLREARALGPGRAGQRSRSEGSPAWPRVPARALRWGRRVIRSGWVASALLPRVSML